MKDDVLDGMEGILTNFKGSDRVVISVTLLRRSVALEIDRSRIAPLGSPRTAPVEVAEELTELGSSGRLKSVQGPNFDFQLGERSVRKRTEG